jgi:flagellar hook protein FlgE
MIQALFNGVSGATTNQFGVDTWSNNIANVNTTAYRADIPTFESVYATALDGVNANSPVSNTTGYGSTVSASTINTSKGSFKVTEEDSFNMAISEDGWFTVGTKTGEIMYTRDGSFTRDADGYLVNSQGYHLYGVDLGKIDGSTFSSDPTKNVELLSDSPTLVPLQMNDDVYFQPTETTYVNSQVNLNSEQHLKSLDDAFSSLVYNGDIQQIATKDISQFYDIQDGYKLTIALRDSDGNLMTDEDTGEVLRGDFTYKAEPDATQGEFNTIEELQNLINNDQKNTHIEFVLSIQDDNFVFKNISGEEFIMDFGAITLDDGTELEGSSIELLQAFSLPERSVIGANGDQIKTAPLFQKVFYEQDMNTLHNDNDEDLGLIQNDDFGIILDGGKKESIIYTNDTDATNVDNGMFNTVEEFVDGIENLLRDPVTGEKRLQVYLQDCRLKFENISDQPLNIEFTSTNVNLISRFGLPTQIYLDPSGETQTSLIKLPTYSSSHEMYDIDGEKYFLQTDYVLKSSNELGSQNEVWDSTSMIYALENDALVSDDYTRGRLEFGGPNVAPKLYELTTDPITGDTVATERVYSENEDENELFLEVNFQGGNFAEDRLEKVIKFNPVGIKEDVSGQTVWSYSSTEKYIDSSVRDRDKDGNAEGYLTDIIVDLNGIVNYYFSNDISEEMGRAGVVNFINQQGLEKVGGNLFRSREEITGKATVMWDNETGLLKNTTVMQGKLETSNVDMNVALTELIVMQRAYSASTKSITTADEMLKKAIDLKK